MPHEKSSKKISLLNRCLLLEIWIPIRLYHTLEHTLSQLSYVVDCEWWTCFTRPIYSKIIITYKTYCGPKLKSVGWVSMIHFHYNLSRSRINFLLRSKDNDFWIYFNHDMSFNFLIILDNRILISVSIFWILIFWLS